MEVFVFLFIIIALLFWYSIIRTRRFQKIYTEAQILKKHASAHGVLYTSPFRSQRDFLDYMGQFFKHKKHEWIFIAFIENNTVDRFWVNKGLDRSSVSPGMGFGEVIKICQENGFNHILVGHNHPAGALTPSRQDRILLEQFIDFLATENITTRHLVFVAGSWRKYGLSIGQHIRRHIGN